MGKSILLVEDNPDDEELTLMALRKHHIANDVVVARDGAQALDILFGAAGGAAGGAVPGGTGPGLRELPEVVLLDLKLPKVDGLEVLRRVRADPRTRYLPVVILTSSAEDADRIAGYALGANSYVQKPVDFVEFADAVRQLGLYWLVLNMPAPSGKG